MSLDDGEIRWEHEADGSIEDAPIVVDGIVYATSRRRGGMIGVDAASGESRAICFPTDLELASLGPSIEHQEQLYVWGLSWVLAWPATAAAVDACDYVPTSPPVATINAGPSAAANAVFVGAGRNIHRFDADSMTEVWSAFPTAGELLGYCENNDWIDSVLLSRSLQGSIATELLVFARDWEGRLYRLDGDSGKITHSVDNGPDHSDRCPGPADSSQPVRARPLLTEEAIYAPTFDDRLAALDLAELAELWSVDVGSIGVGPVLEASVLYLAMVDGQTKAIDTRRRDVAWVLKTELSATGIAVSRV